MSFYKINSMTFSYPKSEIILEDIILKINKDERIGLMGPNACGKTTLVKLLMGVLRPNYGEILLEGKNIEYMALAEIGKSVGFIFQNPEKQIFAPTVWEQMYFPYKFDNTLDDRDVQDKINYHLDLFDLADHKNDLPFNLSLGQKQRLALASVLSRDVDFLIMDEPTTGLDLLRLINFEKYLSLIKDKNKGYIIISHNREFLHRNVDKLLIFKDKGVELL